MDRKESKEMKHLTHAIEQNMIQLESVESKLRDLRREIHNQWGNVLRRRVKRIVSTIFGRYDDEAL